LPNQTPTSGHPDHTDQHRNALIKKVEREDVVMFINTCFAATNQNEYYNNGINETVSVQFLHEYVLFNYRTVYARSLAVGINHFNQATIIINLLATGSCANEAMRQEENSLITTALKKLPANRAFSLLQQLSLRKINNRRARATAIHYLQNRFDPEFDAVKYKRQYRSIVRHAHIDVGYEFSAFLFNYKNQKTFNNEMFENFRQAHYSQSAIYKLPYSIAEPFSVKHGIERGEFLKKIEPKMTRHERLRLQSASARANSKGSPITFDPATASLTRLCIYCLSLPLPERQERAEELHEMLTQAALRFKTKTKITLPKTTLVLDCSQSSRGSRHKANRPLAIAIAVSYMLRALSESLTQIWTPDIKPAHSPNTHYPFLRRAQGQSGLARPVIDALKSKPQLMIIVSDGWENDPPLTVGNVIEVAREKISGVSSINIVHANPVFDPDHFSPRPLSSQIATVGLRDAEDLTTMIEFASFASGTKQLSELEKYLLLRSQQLRGCK